MINLVREMYLKFFFWDSLWNDCQSRKGFHENSQLGLMNQGLFKIPSCFSYIRVISSCYNCYYVFNRLGLSSRFSYVRFITSWFRMPSRFSNMALVQHAFEKMTAKSHLILLLVSSRFSNIRQKWGYRVLVRCITKTRQASDWSSRYRVPSRFSKTPILRVKFA